MAVRRRLITLHLAAAGSAVPYSTLSRWAKQRSWPVYRTVGLKNYYDEHTVILAIQRSRQQRRAEQQAA
jgi:hypothetical protein